MIGNKPNLTSPTFFLSVLASSVFVFEIVLIPIYATALEPLLADRGQTLALFYAFYSLGVVLGVACCAFVERDDEHLHIFLLGLFFFAGGSVLITLYPYTNDIYVARFLQGLGGGLFTPLIPIFLQKLNKPGTSKSLMLGGSFVGFLAAFAPLVMVNIAPISCIRPTSLL